IPVTLRRAPKARLEGRRPRRRGRHPSRLPRLKAGVAPQDDGHMPTKLTLLEKLRALAGLLGLLLLTPAPAGAAQCGGDFHTFIAAMSREAAAQGISQGV